MRQRLHIKFNCVKGKDFIPDFYIDDVLQKESVIESVYNNNTLLASNFHINIIKYGYSDGLMRFKYKNDEVKFYGIQETKRNVANTTIQLKKQLLQALKYRSMLKDKKVKNKLKVICLNSEKFYAYVLIDEIENLETLDKLLIESDLSASKTWNDSILRDFIKNINIPFTIRSINNDIDLSIIQREIYLKCLLTWN